MTMIPQNSLRLSLPKWAAIATTSYSLVLGGTGVAPARAGEAAAVAVGEYAGPKATLLAIDNYSLPFKSNLCYYLSRPAVRADPVLTPSRDNPHAADSLAAHLYGTVLREGGKFRMWYYGVGRRENPEGKTNESSTLRIGPVCYAESDDGLHWIKPKLGQVTCNGGSDNNGIALPASEPAGVFVIRDDADPDSSRRYKMVYENTYGTADGKMPTAETAISPDGITWKGTGTAAALMEVGSFCFFNGLYRVYAQDLTFVSQGGHMGGREGYVWISPDFNHWLREAGESFLLPEPANPHDRGYDRPYVQVHVGVGPVSYGNAMVGLYCQFHARPNAVGGAQPGAGSDGDWFGVGTTYGDFGLVVSNDGQHFREVVDGFVFLDRHRSRPALSPDIRTEEILTPAGNSILNVGGETWIYHGRWMNTENYRDYFSDIALATLPRDRWGALGLYPHATEGEVWSAPLTLGRAGGKVTLNAEAAEGMRVEVADQNFRLMPEFSGENAGVAFVAGGLDCAVAWPKTSLDSLVGRKVRLLIHLKKLGGAEPRLFAVYIE